MKECHNFFIVGGQRCGTTWLYKRLMKHPDVCMAEPMRPEPKYFLKHGEPSVTQYMKLHFSHLRDERFCGEKSTSYYESLNAASNIFSVFPQAKILFILRDPVERILSNYFFSLSNGLETRSPEEAFIEKTEPPRNIGVSVDPCDYYSRSDYASSIKMYWDIFGKEQVGVYLFEEMVSSRNCLEDICNFLGLPFETAYINDFQNEYSSIENRQTRTALISISILTKIRRDCMASVAELSSMIPDLNMELWSTNS